MTTPSPSQPDAVERLRAIVSLGGVTSDDGILADFREITDRLTRFIIAGPTAVEALTKVIANSYASGVAAQAVLNLLAERGMGE